MQKQFQYETQLDINELPLWAIENDAVILGTSAHLDANTRKPSV